MRLSQGGLEPKLRKPRWDRAHTPAFPQQAKCNSTCDATAVRRIHRVRMCLSSFAFAFVDEFVAQTKLKQNPSFVLSSLLFGFYEGSRENGCGKAHNSASPRDRYLHYPCSCPLRCVLASCFLLVRTGFCRGQWEDFAMLHSMHHQ